MRKNYHNWIITLKNKGSKKSIISISKCNLISDNYICSNEILITIIIFIM